MGDAELEAIRAQRMAQLQSQYGGNENTAEKQKAAQERESQINDSKNMILSQVLDQQARARLNTIMAAKPEKAKQVENLLINMAQTGRLQSRVGDSELVNMLNQLSSSTSKTTTVKFDRRRAALDDSDDDFN